MKHVSLLFAFALSISYWCVQAQSIHEGFGHLMNSRYNAHQEHSSLNPEDIAFEVNPEPEAGGLLALNDSIYNWRWDTVATAWRPNRKTLDIVYNADNKRVSQTIQSWDTTQSVWVNQYQMFYAYDSNGNNTSFIQKQWNGTAWVNSYQRVYTYDANNNLTSELNQTGSGTSWVNSSIDTYVYDSSNNMTDHLLRSWESGAWLNESQNSYIYDSNNNEVESLLLMWYNDVWNNNSLILSIYDSNNYPTNLTRKWWVEDVWTNMYQWRSYYDDSGNLIADTSYNWVGTNWVYASLQTTTYDEFGNVVNLLGLSWADTIWENLVQYDYIYNSLNSETLQRFYQWIDGAWEINQREISEYDAENSLVAYSFTFWHEQGTFLSTGDSSRYYFHTVDPACSASFILTPDTIESNWFLSASGTGSYPISYLWEWGDGTTSTEASPSHTFETPGYYVICLTMTDAENCTVTYCDSSTYIFKTGAEMITVNVINNINVGIQEEAMERIRIVVYPSPASSTLTIEQQLAVDNTELTASIYNMQGQMVSRNRVQGQITTMDVSLLRSGIYCLNLSDGKQEVSTRFVKE